jgi:putative acyl-CoA dehydrogenase
MSKSPESVSRLIEEISIAQNAHPLIQSGIQRLKTQLEQLSQMTADQMATQARRMADQMALLYQATLLYRFQPSSIADAFCVARLADDRGYQYGDLSPSIDVNLILNRYQNL